MKCNGNNWTKLQMNESSSQTISCFKLHKTAISFHCKLIMDCPKVLKFNFGVFELWICLNSGSISFLDNEQVYLQMGHNEGVIINISSLISIASNYWNILRKFKRRKQRPRHSTTVFIFAHSFPVTDFWSGQTDRDSTVLIRNEFMVSVKKKLPTKKKGQMRKENPSCNLKQFVL